MLFGRPRKDAAQAPQSAIARRLTSDETLTGTACSYKVNNSTVSGL